VFDILADPQSFACQTELLLDCFVGCDEAGWVVGSEEVPGVEAGEILKCSEELVTADYHRRSAKTSSEAKARSGFGWEGFIVTGGRNEAKVVGYSWMVDDCISDHDGTQLVLYKEGEMRDSRCMIDRCDDALLLASVKEGGAR